MRDFSIENLYECINFSRKIELKFKTHTSVKWVNMKLILSLKISFRNMLFYRELIIKIRSHYHYTTYGIDKCLSK